MAITTSKKSSGIFTFSGNIIDPLNPRPEDIDIRDIAGSLCKMTRFTGHTKDFEVYSVAQHSVLASEYCEMYPAEGLLHDAAEAYLADLARPIKAYKGLGEAYKEVEAPLEMAIAEKYDLVYPWPKEVKEIDTRLLVTEMRDLMPGALESEFLDEDLRNIVPLKQTIVQWSPRQAHGEFMVRFLELL